ncbi:MAG: hypothetical protein L6Q99_00015 [Planctomycetes bacterium]|nr:hypothetical protein [Planctomycetota bacterium]
MLRPFHSPLLSVAALAAVTSVFASVAAAAESAVFRGLPGAAGDVIAFDVAAPGAAHTVTNLTGVQLLDLDFAGHSAGDQLAARFPRRRADQPGAARLALQQGRGSLYRYVRSSAGGDTYGFFVVDALGVRILHTLTVASGAPDPFVPTIAVSPDGATLLVATTLAAGGDLVQIDVATGNSLARTTNQGPLDFAGSGLALGASTGFAVHASGALRFPRAQAGNATDVPFPAPAPTWFSRELVLSPQGTVAATTAGSTADQAFVFSLGASGSAVRVSTLAASLSGAGFFPAANGPHLAISDDGSTVAWRTEGLKREAFVAHAQPVGGELPEQLTSDARFLDTLDEIGLYGFRPASNRLVLAIGDVQPNLPNTLDSADFFAVDLPTGQPPVFTNLSLSSGDATVPFTIAPTLKPTLVHWFANADAFLVHDGASELLYRVQTTASGAQALLQNAKDVEWIEPVGTDLLLSVRSASGSKPRELWRIDAGLTGAPTLVHTFPSGNELHRVAPRADGRLALVESGAPTEFLWLYDGAGPLKLLTTRPFTYGPSIGFAPNGALLFGIGAVGAPTLFGAWPQNGAPKRLPILPPLQPGWVLPGA